MQKHDIPNCKHVKVTPLPSSKCDFLRHKSEMCVIYLLGQLYISNITSFHIID